MRDDSPQAGTAAMEGLRMRALSLRAEDIGLNRQKFPHEVWGTLFETAYEKYAFTLLVLAGLRARSRSGAEAGRVVTARYWIKR